MAFIQGFSSVIYIVVLFEIQFYLVNCQENYNNGGPNNYNYCPQNLALQYYGANINVRQKNGIPTKPLNVTIDYDENVSLIYIGPSIAVFSNEQFSKNSMRGGPFPPGNTYNFYSYQMYVDCAANGNGGLTYNGVPKPIFISTMYYDASKYDCIETAIQKNGVVFSGTSVNVNSTSPFNPKFQNFLDYLNDAALGVSVELSYEVATSWYVPSYLPSEQVYYGYSRNFVYPNGKYRENGAGFTLVQALDYITEISSDQLVAACKIVDPQNALLYPRPAIMSQGNPKVNVYKGPVNVKYS